MQYTLTHKADAKSASYGDLSPELFQGDNLVDSVALTLAGNTKTISTVELYVRRNDGKVVLVGIASDDADENNITVDENTIIWKISALCTAVSGKLTVQVRVYYDDEDDSSCTELQFGMLVRKRITQSVAPEMVVVDAPTLTDIKIAEAERVAASANAVNRANNAAEMCENIVYGTGLQTATNLLAESSDIADADALPMYDASASAHRKITWASIKTVLGNVFAPSAHVATHAVGGADALAPSDIGAVPTTRKVNNKALSSDITLTASDVSAVPTSRKVNNKALSADITLSASDVSAAPAVSTATSMTSGTALVDNTEYYPSSALGTFSFVWPSGNFEVYIKFTTGSTVSITFPAATTYIGGAPTFEASKTYEMSVKNGVVVAAEVVAS